MVLNAEMSAPTSSVRPSSVTRAEKSPPPNFFAASEMRRSGVVPAPGELDIRYEDGDLVVLNKAPGVTVHPGPGHFYDTVGNFLLWHYDQEGAEADFHPVHRLDRSIEYVKDKEKTTQKADSLEAAIDYAMNRTKTEQAVFEDTIGCTNENAYEDMVATKKRFHKTGGVAGYHLVQSFAEGEVTPELAHLIGQELADRLLKGQYEVVITTHLNTRHYHNHIVWNSVSMADGRKYHSNAKSYYTEIRKISDDLCRKYGLSIIESNQKKSIPYVQWKAEQEGKPTWRMAIRLDIRESVQESYSWLQFLKEMEKRGYTWKLNRKYISLKAPGYFSDLMKRHLSFRHACPAFQFHSGLPSPVRWQVRSYRFLLLPESGCCHL